MARRHRAALFSVCLLAGAGCLLGLFASPTRPMQAQTDPPPEPRLIYLPVVANAHLSCDAVALRKGPQLVLTDDRTEMKVVWQLAASLPAILEWGENLQYSLGMATTAETGPSHRHRYTITGLAPDTRYFYRVTAGGVCSAGSFYTAPSAATDLKFFAYGDTRNGIRVHDSIADQIIAAYHADPAFQTFNLAVGDLVSNGDLESAWESEFYDPSYPRLRTLLAHLAFLPVMGNHEASGALFTRYFPLPFVAGRYWSFDYGPAHVVMLDQYTSYAAGSPQYAWLVNDLAASTKVWKFIILHEPGWSAGGGHLNNVEVQTILQPLAERYGVSLIFGGHNHYYARAVSNGVQHLTVGGGGAPLHTPDLDYTPEVVAAEAAHSFAEIVISGSILTGTILRPDGTPIETFTLTR